MLLPALKGVIRRRLLVNYRADPEVVQALLPQGFRPQVLRDRAVVGICLIRLEQIRPVGLPEMLSVSSENAAHRIAVEWKEQGEWRQGVFIPRRDSDSPLNALVGGRLFPGEHHRAEFSSACCWPSIQLAAASRDGTMKVELKGAISDALPSTSLFSSLDEASSFFEKGELGWSARRRGRWLDGMRLKVDKWKVEPLRIDLVRSSFYDNRKLFPEGSVTFDHALIMRDIHHQWHGTPRLDPAAAV